MDKIKWCPHVVNDTFYPLRVYSSWVTARAQIMPYIEGKARLRLQVLQKGPKHHQTPHWGISHKYHPGQPVFVSFRGSWRQTKGQILTQNCFFGSCGIQLVLFKNSKIATNIQLFIDLFNYTSNTFSCRDSQSKILEVEIALSASIKICLLYTSPSPRD